ncbi:hypothetical protein PIB30_097307 [Stylosanthes scabra]|uniref:Aminotransferase-like plant mobile domain-containing protein n=1 Tax=Stylosanthes scabra TaxID=79078 RepID=A0ABU6WUG4_9FABA|nr:hypothetical protein [Stylosanthes scabra]
MGARNPRQDAAAHTGRCAMIRLDAYFLFVWELDILGQVYYLCLWKFVQLLQDFESICGYSWGFACLAHLYRALCRASRYDCKEMDSPQTLLITWAWERMPWIAPIPGHKLGPLTWNCGPRRHDYSSYGGHTGAWFYLMGYMKTCPFPSILAHCCPSSASYRRPGDALKWQDHEQTCLRGQPVISFENHDHYMEWYRKRIGQWLSLADIAKPSKKILVPQTHHNKMIKCHFKKDID